MFLDIQQACDFTTHTPGFRINADPITRCICRPPIEGGNTFPTMRRTGLPHLWPSLGFYPGFPTVAGTRRALPHRLTGYARAGVHQTKC